MKRTITHNLDKTMPDTTKPFCILTDASKTGIGAVLLQQHPTEKKMKLISANSRLFTPIEMKLSTLIRECSAIIFALPSFYSQTQVTQLYYLQTINRSFIYLLRKTSQTIEYIDFN